MRYKVEVIADNSGKWVGNGLTFATPDEGETYARDLFSRWTQVRKWRVVDTETPKDADGSYAVVKES